MPEASEVAFSPDLILPFHSYRRLKDQQRPLHDLAPSVTHFYESEKFRGVDELLRQEVLSCPTPRAAVKLAKRQKDHWRSDWSRVRPYVLRAGLAMQMAQSSEARVLARAGFERAIEMAGAKRVGSLPGLFVSRVLTNLFETMQQRTSLRLGALCIEGYVPADIEQRLDALAHAQPPLAATVYGGPESSTALERWCMKHGVAVRVVGANDTRLRASDHRELVERVNTLVLCAPRTRKAVADLVAALNKTKGSKVRVLDYTQPRAARAD